MILRAPALNNLFPEWRLTIRQPGFVVDGPPIVDDREHSAR